MDLDTQFQNLSERMTLIRGKGAFGRKPNRSLLNHVAQFGTVDVHHYDDTTGQSFVESVQDVGPILEDAKRQLLSGDDGYTPSRELRKVATIPQVVADNLASRGINILDNNDWPKIAAMLDGGELAAWRTSEGTISRRPYREYFTLKGR